MPVISCRASEEAEVFAPPPAPMTSPLHLEVTFLLTQHLSSAGVPQNLSNITTLHFQAAVGEQLPSAMTGQPDGLPWTQPESPKCESQLHTWTQVSKEEVSGPHIPQMVCSFVFLR